MEEAAIYFNQAKEVNERSGASHNFWDLYDESKLASKQFAAADSAKQTTPSGRNELQFQYAAELEEPTDGLLISARTCIDLAPRRFLAG